MDSEPSTAKPMILTSIAMLAFAGNSILCRLALVPGLADAGSFTVARVASGAAAMTVLTLLMGNGFRSIRFDWRPAAALTGYLLSFSYGYLSLSTATGALVLFGAVQLTMLSAAWRRGERLGRSGLAGLALALLGLGYLLAPGVTRPDLSGTLLMAASGVCWGLYSLSGSAAANPVASTAGNFLFAMPITMLICVPLMLEHGTTLSGTGLLLGTASGVVASACGYAIWFAALGYLSAARAAVVQLSVPVLATAGGWLLLSEPATPRLLIASALTLAGIWLVLTQRRHG